MNTTANPDEALAFLAERFPALQDGETIEIRPILGRRVAGQRWFSAAEEAARYALSLTSRHHVYYGVNPRRGQGGSKAHVARVTQLHLDVDFKVYAEGRNGALAAVGRLPLPPTYVVDSGGGLQVGYALADPIIPSGPDDPAVARVEHLLKRLYQAFGGLDSVQDVSRVLRVPGTLNHKYDPPRPVALLRHDPDRCYTLEQFEALLPPAPPVRPPAAAPTERSPQIGDTPAIDELRELLRHIPPTGDYQTHWLAVLMAVHTAYPGPEGVALCEAWSPGHPGEIARKFASFKRHGVGIGTLLHLAKQHGWRPPERLAPAPMVPSPTVSCGAQDASHSAPADRPDLSGLPEDVRAYIARIEAALAAKEREVDQLGAQVTTLLAERNDERAHYRGHLQVLHNETVKPAVRLAVAGLADVLEDAARKGKTEPDGWTPLYLAAVADQAALNERRIGTLVEEAAELGLIEKTTELHRKTVQRADGTTKSVLCSTLRVRPAGGSVAAMLRQAATVVAPEHGHGGERPKAEPKPAPARCPDHPQAPHLLSCTVCGTMVDEREPAVVETSGALAGCGAQDASHSDAAGHAAAEAPTMAPPVEQSPVKQAQHASHSPALHGVGWMGARARPQPADGLDMPSASRRDGPGGPLPIAADPSSADLAAHLRPDLTEVSACEMPPLPDVVMPGEGP